MTRPAAPTAGWYADPNGGSGLRYWDGAGWTADTQTSPPPLPIHDHSGGGAQYGAAAYAQQGAPPDGQPGGPPDGQPGGFPGRYPQAARGGTTVNAFARSRYAMITVAICVVYAVIATYSSYAFFGVLPVLFTVRSFRAREPLAVLALVLTVATVVYSIYRTSH